MRGFGLIRPYKPASIGSGSRCLSQLCGKKNEAAFVVNVLALKQAQLATRGKLWIVYMKLRQLVAEHPELEPTVNASAE